MKVLVCGGRDYRDDKRIFSVLDAISAVRPITEIVEGDGTGADAIAGLWATARNIRLTTIPAQWRKYGKMAGPIRNAAMLDEEPKLVVAFPGGRGTANTVGLAKAAKIPVLEIGK